MLLLLTSYFSDGDGDDDNDYIVTIMLFNIVVQSVMYNELAVLQGDVSNM